MEQWEDQVIRMNILKRAIFEMERMNAQEVEYKEIEEEKEEESENP